MKIYCGIDWAEAHHDVAVIDDTGQRLAKTRISDDLRGFTALCELLADVAGLTAGAQPLPVGEGFIPVDIAIETDRGLLVAALRAAGHRVWSINPKAVDRYRDRYSGSRAKSDPGGRAAAGQRAADRRARTPPAAGRLRPGGRGRGAGQDAAGSRPAPALRGTGGAQPAPGVLPRRAARLPRPDHRHGAGRADLRADADRGWRTHPGADP